MIEEPATAVLFVGESLPKKPEVTIWHWLAYYAFNLTRKPFVWRKQKELLKIYKSIKQALEIEVYPLLIAHAKTCPDCKDAYAALLPQVFLSQIELIIRKMGCDFHPEIFNAFITKYADKFKESEKIAKWINHL